MTRVQTRRGGSPQCDQEGSLLKNVRFLQSKFRWAYLPFNYCIFNFVCNVFLRLTRCRGLQSLSQIIPCFTRNIGLLKRCTAHTARSETFIWLPIDFMKKVITSCSLVCSQWLTNTHLRPSASAEAFAALTCKWDNQLNCWLSLHISINEQLACFITRLNRSLITIS